MHTVSLIGYLKLVNVECKEQNQSANLNDKFEENSVEVMKM